jgi:two-component system sensor histidine kinase BarA
VNNRLHRLGIGHRILLIFTIPLFLIILGLGTYATNMQMNDARTALLDRGALMAKHLADLSEFGLYSVDTRELHRQAESEMREADVRHVKIINSSGNVLVHIDKGGTEPEAGQIVTFTAPVLRTGIEVLDFDIESGETPATDSSQPIGSIQIGLSTAAMEHRRNTILLTGITLTSSALLLSILLAYLVARSVTGPIIQLTGIVNQLTGGRLSARSPGGSPGELGSLEQGINQMAGTLEDTQKQLRKEVEEATAALQETVRKLETRNAELDQARSDAINAGAAKSDFLARMSHEIRTPLSAVIGFSGLLERTGLSENQQEYIRTITQAASQLLLIIDDILGHTRLDSNVLDLESIPFDLNESLENVIGMFSTQAHEKQLELVLYIHSDVPQYITSDPNRIGQLLTNLVNNAIKFTDHGHVIVEVTAVDADSDTATINFAVTDTGIGLTESEQTHIFDPFIQADISTSRKYGGTGLGLSICKKLSDLLGGEIHVSSTPGKGSTFSFTITVPYEITAKGNAVKPLAGRKVLVYDRNPFTLRALRNRFFTWGATVFNTADRGKLMEILAADAQQGSPCELLVMGLSPDEYDGIPRDAWLQDVRRICASPAIVLIGDELHDLPTCLADTQMCILSKPPRSDRLLRIIRKTLLLDDEPSTENIVSTVNSGQEKTFRCLNVLVVEDNRFNQQLFEQLLSSLGTHVALAENGEEACRLAAHRLFDLIFMDIHMPVMGGIRATQVIREGTNRLTPIIALTADVFADSDHYLQSLGLDDILYKPVSEQKLAGMLHKWCKPPAQDTDTGERDTVALPPGFQERLKRELGRQLIALRKALDSNDQALFAEHMHQLKGMVQYFGLTEFTDKFRSLEKARDTGSAQTVHEVLDTLETLLAGIGSGIRAT